jgi:DNA-binding transcriptional regulator GbsR (MarR family)
MQLKVKKRMDIVQYIVKTMGRVSEETRGQAAVGEIQVLLRLCEGEVTPKDLADALEVDEDKVAESLEIFEEFGIVDICDADIPTYTYAGYPEEIKFLLSSKANVKKKFGDAINDVESLVKNQHSQTPEEEQDLRVLSEMVAQMKKDFGV